MWSPTDTPGPEKTRASDRCERSFARVCQKHVYSLSGCSLVGKFIVEDRVESAESVVA